MRVALGRFTHEANTFSPHLTDLDDFRSRGIRRGMEILEDAEGTNTEMAGAVSVFANEPSCEIAPLLSAAAVSGGPIIGEVFRGLLHDLLSRLESALPVDGVLLVLHGAMMVDDEPDATGEILRSVRDLVGLSVPVVGTLDLHANVTNRMVRQATALVGYHTAPHTDMFETGESAARILLGTVNNGLSPTMALVRLPLIVAAENARHDDGPLSEVINAALSLEERGEILHGGIYPVQPWLDIEDVASSVLVITDGSRQTAAGHANSLAQAFWSKRSEFVPDLVASDEAVRRSLSRVGGTVVLADSADAPSSGSTGDSTVLLKAVLDASPQEKLVLLNIVDTEAVAQAIDEGVGARVSLKVGGKLAPGFYAPVSFTGRVKMISDGTFKFKGPGMRGVEHHMGRTVVLVKGGVHLVVMERPVTQWDPQLYRSLGEEPTDACIVQVKSPAGFRAGYEGIAEEVMVIASPGVATPQFSTLPWGRLRRPIYPLDPDTSFFTEET